MACQKQKRKPSARLSPHRLKALYRVRSTSTPAKKPAVGSATHCTGNNAAAKQRWCLSPRLQTQKAQAGRQPPSLLSGCFPSQTSPGAKNAPPRPKNPARRGGLYQPTAYAWQVHYGSVVQQVCSRSVVLVVWVLKSKASALGVAAEPRFKNVYKHP